MLAEYVEVNKKASILIERFLPGPLTIVLRERKEFPKLISAGSKKIAVRISRHPFVMNLFNFIDFPITSTSANISGDRNLLEFNQILETFNEKVDLIVDSGNIPPSKGSTIVDLTTDPPQILREGDIKKEELEGLL